MTYRRQLSTRARLDFFLAHKGRCASCTMPIPPGKGWDIDHIIPLALGGSDTTENMQILCKPCHGTKTARRDVPAIAKAERARAHHLGARRASQPLPCGRASKYKRTMTGRIILR
jgi:5-methylcytosine-specific restriction protein A